MVDKLLGACYSAIGLWKHSRPKTAGAERHKLKTPAEEILES